MLTTLLTEAQPMIIKTKLEYELLEKDPRINMTSLVPNYPRYEFVENDGIYSLNWHNSGVRKKIKIQLSKDGYPQVLLYNNRGRKLIKLHKIAAEIYFGKRPMGFQINHISGNKLDWSRNNLEYVTPSQNVKHSFDINLRNQIGEKNPNSKLTSKDITIIRKRINLGESSKDIAISYNVTRNLIYQIKNNKIWQTV